MPLRQQQRSETAIVAGIANATLGNQPVDWLALAGDYSLIRDHIAATLPGFKDFNARCEQPGGFYLGNAAAELRFNTPNHKVNFCAAELPKNLFPQLVTQQAPFTLQPLRSHDQTPPFMVLMTAIAAVMGNARCCLSIGRISLHWGWLTVTMWISRRCETMASHVR